MSHQEDDTVFDGAVVPDVIPLVQLTTAQQKTLNWRHQKSEQSACCLLNPTSLPSPTHHFPIMKLEQNHFAWYYVEANTYVRTLQLQDSKVWLKGKTS